MTTDVTFDYADDIRPIEELYEKEQNSEEWKELDRKYNYDNNGLWFGDVHAPLFTDSEIFSCDDQVEFYEYDEKYNNYAFYGKKTTRWYDYKEGFGWFVFQVRESSEELMEYLRKKTAK